MAEVYRVVKMNSSDIKTISTKDAPIPAGHYVQATVCNGLVYVAGQLPVHADGKHAPEAPFAEQAQQAMQNLLAIVKSAGSSPERLLKVNAYIVGVENWPKFNQVYAQILGDIKPARAVVPVPELHYGYLIEIDAVASLNPQ
jgi:2-iminobutanoate/2-iminopropanoate deaminase